jgi:replicative DNA helicase
MKSCQQILDGPGFDPDVHLDEIRTRIEAATAYAGATALRPNSEAVYEVLGALEDDVEPGLPTGYPDLDDVISLRPGELTVIGARPGQGKSLIALCIADHIGTRLGLPVLFSSLEMTEEELTQRRIAAAAKVPLQHIVRHQVTDAEWKLIQRAQEHLTVTSLYVDDTTSVSPAYIRGKLRAMARTGREARLLVIDYLGFMAAPKAESRQQAVAELARQSKNIARDFSIPVILLAQLNRGSEHRAEKRPQLSDLRESGEIEQPADNVILLHREDAYEPESPRAGEIDAIILKHRQGQQVTVTLCFQGQYGRIVSLGPQSWSPSKSAE